MSILCDLYDLKTHSVRNVFQSREAWEVDIQPHIWTQTLHQTTAININIIPCLLTYCSMVYLQRRKVLWCLIET